MNKKMIKTVTVGALVLALSSTSLFAKDLRREALHEQMKTEKLTAKGVDRTTISAKVKLLGTVSAIDTNTQTLTVKNADGNEVKVHVNPYTYIERDSLIRNREISLSDVKTGDWVAVNNFGTDTTVLEAKHIFVSQQ